VAAGKKRREKEVEAMRSAPVFLCSESATNSRPKYQDHPVSVKEISVVRS